MFSVYSKLQKRPQAIFDSYSWAQRFVTAQQLLWKNAKFKIVNEQWIKSEESKKWYQFWK